MNIEKTIEQLEAGVVEFHKIENWLFTSKEYRDDLKSKTQHAFKGLFNVLYNSNPSQFQRIFDALKWYQMPAIEKVLGKAPTLSEYLKYATIRDFDADFFRSLGEVVK